MKKLNILVLTDHSTHAPSNSVYGLCNALRKEGRVEHVWIASRGQKENQSFFYDFDSDSVIAYPLNQDIDFDWGQQTIGIVPGTSVQVNSYDLVWLRLPRPIPAGFFSFLETSFPNQQFINRPSGIELSSNKAYLLQVAELCPPVQVCRTIEEIDQFSQQFEIVIKPLEDYGGKGIVRVHKGAVLKDGEYVSLKSFAPHLEEQLKRGGYLGMKFLKGVSAGDKRVIVVNGQVIGGILRIPAPGSWLCNASQGGEGHISGVDPEEEFMAKRLHEKLAPLGIAMFGMDTLLGDQGKRVLSEVNTLSIGGIQPLDEISEIPAAELVVRNLIDFAENF